MLTDAVIRQRKPAEKAFRLADGEGLYLLIRPSGARWWRFDYRYQGARLTIGLGAYPKVTLSKARGQRAAARALLDAGKNPSRVRREQARTAKGDSFETLAREWLAAHHDRMAPATRSKLLWICTAFLFPAIGSRSIRHLEPPDILAVLRVIEEKGRHDTTHRAKQLCGQIFRYAIASGAAVRDPSADLKGALAPVIHKHRASITDPVKIAALLRALDGFDGTLVVKYAFQLLALVFVRPVELRKAEWSEVSLEAARWNIPASRMKMRQEHIVPLSTQAVTLLRELHALTGHTTFLFPGHRSPKVPLSEGALIAALRRIGYTKSELTAHGFRAMARTVLAEVLMVDPYQIEAQLAHVAPGPLGAAYNRALYLPQRTVMMQTWADYLDALRKAKPGAAL